MLALYSTLVARLEKNDWILPTLARAVFASTLMVYYWVSGMTKLGNGALGVLQPSSGAYAQIFPRAFEAVGYDSSQLSVFHWLVVLGGTWAEFILPALILLGLFTRIAAFGMIGFVILQSLTDIWGHSADQSTIGQLFDRFPDAIILDQRAFWLLALIVIVIKGAGPLSFDRVLRGPR